MFFWCWEVSLVAVLCCIPSTGILWCQVILVDYTLSNLLCVSHLSSFILNEVWVKKASFPALCTSIGLLNSKKSIIWTEDWFIVECFSSFFIATGFRTCVSFLIFTELWVAGKCFSLFCISTMCMSTQMSGKSWLTEKSFSAIFTFIGLLTCMDSMVKS